MKAEGSAEFEQQVKSKSGFEKVTATYDCYGWSSEFPPKPVTTLDNLVEASGQFRLQDGRCVGSTRKECTCRSRHEAWLTRP